MIAPFLLSVLSQGTAFAAAADCAVKDKAFSVEFSLVPDKANREKIKQNVFIKADKKEISIIKDGPGNIQALDGGQMSACTGTAAYILDDQTIAILFAKSDPPFPSRLMMVVYDAKAEKILKIEKDLGAMAKVESANEGFVFSTKFRRTDIDTLQMKSPVSGKAMPAHDEDLEVYQHVYMKKKKLIREFDPETSFDQSEWKRFFKNQEEYLSATGWDAKKKVFKYKMVYKASDSKGKEADGDEICIGFAEKRSQPIYRNKWYCSKDKF